MPSGRNGFCTWKRETQKPEPTIDPGSVPPVSGTSDDLSTGIQPVFQGRNNYCKTDPDATFMHMKDDHMRNAQLKPGYNVQIAVDSEYIVATEIFQDRNDVWTLVPFLKHMEAKLGFDIPV